MIDIEQLSGSYAVTRLDESHAEEVLRLCQGNTLYYQYCGEDPTLESVRNDLTVTPAGKNRADKYYVGFYCGGRLAAVMDLIDGYPETDTAYVGFFMVDAALQGKGAGSAIIEDVCAYLGQTGKTAVRLAIAEDNPQANHFWKKNGFSVLYKADMSGWTALVAEKSLRCMPE